MIGRALHVLVRAVLVTIGVATVIWSAPESAPAGPDGESSWFRFLKRWAFRAAILGALAGIAGAVVVVSGVVPIKASSGHWGITEAFLQFAKRRSVSMHTLTVDVPDLDDGRLVTMGAGHFDFGCRPCHGSPALTQPTIAAQMLPRPPDLRESVAKHDPAALFYIVKHGIKLTGMPAWPALERDDEVWAMVAFLRRLPALDERQYRELAGTLTPTTRTTDSPEPLADLVVPEDPPQAVTESCARCHGLDGLGRGVGAFPRLAGQRPAYLLASIKAYARGERHSGIMGPVAAGLDGTSMQQIATYYASRQTASPGGSEPMASDVERGRAIATNGLPERLVPPCAECHGPGARRRNPVYPVLAGQYAEYLVQQLSLFKAGQRGGTEYHHIMYKVASQLTDDQIRAVAAYYASLDARPHPTQ